MVIRTRYLVLVTALFMVVYTLFHGTYYFTTSRAIASSTAQNDTEIARAGNRTLGFEKVFVLGLPERSDKKDAIVLASSLTGFDVEWIDGVKADAVPYKALPAGLSIASGYLGSWRGHLNAIRSVLERRLSSALIMEDDMDWDTRLLSQMPQFAKGVRSVSNISLTTPQDSPYGDDWDVVWPGNCGDGGYPWSEEESVSLFITNNDRTVPPKAQLGPLGVLKDFPDHTRVVHRGVQPICTFAYAVSFKGAQKLLALIGVHPRWSIAFDLQLALICRYRLLGIKCITVSPTLFNHHRSAGDPSKDSDIKVVDRASGWNVTGKVKGEKHRDKGFSDNIVYSARLNLEQMILGSGPENYTMQW